MEVVREHSGRGRRRAPCFLILLHMMAFFGFLCLALLVSLRERDYPLYE